MNKLIIKESTSSKYTPRTYYNAKSADLTVAFAVDFSTAGERCTHKAAGANIVQLKIWKDMSDEYLLNHARVLWRHCKNVNLKSLNVAGNGIYTFSKHMIFQPEVDSVVFRIISKVHEYWKFDKIYSGGQTGADLAGAKAGYKLGIETEVTLPKGYVQRFTDGIDYSLSKEIIERQIREI